MYVDGSLLQAMLSAGSGAKFTQGEFILYHELKLEVFR
jgi:membrane-bound inhibitor of C-type lysozyme